MPTQMKEEMDDFDFDTLLNLEQQFYDEGFKEGQLAMTKQQLREGKELGIQTGFQRFLIIGEYRALIGLWIKQVDDLKEKTLNSEGTSSGTNNKQKDWNKVRVQLEDIKRLIDSLFENDKLCISNSESDVIKFESVLKKARGKIRTMSGFMGDLDIFKKIEDTNQLVGGSIQTSINDDDAW